MPKRKSVAPRDITGSTRIEAKTLKDKIYVLEYALKVAVTMRDQEFLSMQKQYTEAYSDNWRLRQEIKELKRQLASFLPCTGTSGF
jgi:hypothetical protein